MASTRNPVVAALTERARRRGADPLLTWYGADGARTELSARSYANWVDKTANLLDQLEVTGSVAAPVSVTHPGHWMSLIWPLAAWQHGVGYLAGEPDQSSGLVVVGPEAARPRPGLVTIACSLHPLGRPLPGLPAGVLDFASEALAEADLHRAATVEPDQVAWLGAGQRFSHAETGTVKPQAGRILVQPGQPWATLAAAVLGPLLGGGSAVVVEAGRSSDDLARLAAAERVG